MVGNRCRFASSSASASRSVMLFSSVDCTSIVIRMLVAGDGGHLLRAVTLHRGLARQIRDAHHPAEPGFGAILPRRDHVVRSVERAGHDLDARTIDAAEAQGRAAGRAEIALGNRGGAEGGRLAL